MHACVLYVCHRACLCRKVVTCGNLPATVSSLQSTSESFHSNQGWQKNVISKCFVYVCMNVCKGVLTQWPQCFIDGVLYRVSSFIIIYTSSSASWWILGYFGRRCVVCVLEVLYTRVNLFKIIYKIYFKISLLNYNVFEILLL